MEFSDTVKIEVDPNVIDLDDDDSPENIVVEWHLEMKRFFDKNTAVIGENNLVNVMKEYIQTITTRAIHFEDIETLKTMVEQHVEFIYWLYRDLDLCFSDTYLDNMEHIMTFYLNLTLRTLLALKRKMKVTQKMVTGMTENIVKRLMSFLLESEYHIFHVLIRQTITSADDVVKDVLNILQSNICKQLFKHLYMHFLVLSPIRDKSDEAFCRVYILFENWKAFEDNKQNDKADDLMRDRFGRGPECIKNNKFLSLILQPQVSVISELIRVIGCDPGITKSYFDYIKSRHKQELEILEDIEKLALEDRGWEDDEDDDEEYSDLYDKMVGDSYKEPSSEIQNNHLVKEEKKSEGPIVEDDEVIYCGSDSDSDIEIVSIIPSKSYGTLANMRRKLYIETLKNTGSTKPPKTSFLDSISIDNESKCYSGPNTCEIDKQIQPKQLIEDSCLLSKNKNGVSDGTSTDSKAVEKIECSRTFQSTISCLESETLSGSQDVQNSTNTSVIAADAQSCSSAADSKTDESISGTVISDVSEKCRTPSVQSEISISNSVENTCCNHVQNLLICSKESLKDCKDPISESSEIISHYDSIEELPKNKDGSWQNEIQKSDSTICNNLQTQSEIEESPPINLTDSPIENSKLTENLVETDVSTIEVSPKSQNGNFNIAKNASTFQLKDHVQEVAEDCSNSIKENINEDSCDQNSNIYTTTSPKAVTSSHEEDMDIMKNSTCSIRDFSTDRYSSDSYRESCERRTFEICNENDVISPESCDVSKDAENRVNHTNNSQNVSQKCPGDVSDNDVHSESFAQRTVEKTNYVESEELEKRSDHQIDEQLHLQSHDQLDLQACQSEKPINCLKVNSVLQINNTIEQNSPDAQRDETVQLPKSQDGIPSVTKTPCVNSNNLSEKTARCNGELRKDDSILRKGELKLIKRRHSDSNVYECSGANRWCTNFEDDFVRDKSDLKVVDSLSQESVNSSKVRVNGQSGASIFLDTGQCVPPQPLDTGQAQVIEELSPPMTDSGEHHVRDTANASDSNTAQHICSEKRTESQSDKDELCGYPTPPGSEEDVDDTQPDPVYSNIFPTPKCSSTGDCYRNDRAVFRINSESERDATVDDDMATTGQVVSQTRMTDSRKDTPAEIVVPENVYSEQTMSENDFLTEEIDPGDPLVSLEEEELLDRLSDEEKNEENESDNRNLTKAFSQIAMADISVDREDVTKQTKNANEFGQHRKAAQRTPPSNKKQLTFSPENDDFDEMAQFLENHEKQYDANDSSTSSKKRKRQIKDVHSESSPQSREKSQIKRRKMGRKVESRIKSFDEFEAEVWNRQSPIGKFAYDCDSSDTDETTGKETTRPNSRTKRIGTPTAREKPSSSPFSVHLQNVTTMDLPPLSCNTSTPKQPPLKGVLKKVEQSHSYHPLHPVDEDPPSSYVYIPLEPDPNLERGKLRTKRSVIKVSRKSLTACKVSRDYKRLFDRYARVSLDHVWRNKDLEWENISDPSKRILWERMPQRSYRIDYDKSANDSLNYQIFFIDQSATDEPSAIVNTRNPNLQIGHASGTVNLSNEIVCIETADVDPSHAVQLHLPSISPCVSPSSNASSEFSDPTNLIPYQDIERALQVVEPDDQTCYNCSANDGQSGTSDQVEHDSCDMFDNMSVEAIKLLSNNADFHKIFCDFEGEILIENVPVLDTDETETILNIDGTFVKPLPKVDVRLSDKLTDDLILNLNSDEELLKKICQELETKSLVDSISSSADNAARINPNEFLNFSEAAHQDANRLSPTENEIPNAYSNGNASSNNTISIESVEKEFEPAHTFSQNSTISLSKSRLNSPSSILSNCSKERECTIDEFHSDDYQLSDQTINRECMNIQHSDHLKSSNSQRNPQVSQSPLDNNQYFQSAQVNTQSFQNSQMYQTSQVFQSSRIGQPLICSPLKESFQSLQKPSLIVNLPMPRDSLKALSQKKNEHANVQTTSNALKKFTPANLDVAAISNASYYNSMNPLQGLSGALEPLQMDIIPAQHVEPQNEVPSSTNIHIRNAFIFPPENKPKKVRRGRPPKKSKKLKEKPQTVPNRVKQPAISDNYQERVPPIYHQELLPVQKHVGPDQGKSKQDAAGGARDNNKVGNEAGAPNFKRAAAVAKLHESYILSESWAKYSSTGTGDVQSNSSVHEETPKKGRKRRSDPNNTKRATPRKRKDESPDPEKSNYFDYLGRVLSQSLDCYRKQQEEAESKLSSSEARRLGLIITKFEKAIRRHNLGKPVAIDNLPVPIELLQSTEAAHTTATSADEFSPGFSSSETKSTPSGRHQPHRRSGSTVQCMLVKDCSVTPGRRKNSNGSKNLHVNWNS